MILTSLSPSAVPCIESSCDMLPVVLLCCGSGSCVDVPSSLLFVAVVGCVSTGVDGNAPLVFFSVFSGCGGSGCINVSLTLVFVDVGGCNRAGLEAMPIIVAAMGAPVVVLAIRAPLGVRAYPWIVSKKVCICLWVPTGKDGVYALHSVLTLYATKSLKNYGSCSTPDSSHLCVPYR